MNVRFTALVCLLICSCAEVKAPPPPDAARVLAFTADKNEIGIGERVTLTFRTENATEVQLLDDAGRFIELTGDVAEGTAVVAPARTTFYIVRANGPGGRDTAFLQLAVGERAREVFLLSVPAEINAGEASQLLWGAAGAASVTLQSGSEAPVALTGGTGTVNVSPARSERYTLSSSSGANQPVQTALTEVRVRPQLLSLSLEAPNGIEVGRQLTVRWRSRGAQRLLVRELTFGQLLDVSDPAQLDDGTATWTVPDTLPTGLPIQIGVPVRFEVTVSSNAGTQIQTVVGVVGDAPLIERVTAPEAASSTRSFIISWNTINAATVGIEANGELLFETLPSERARAEAGSVSLPTPGVATTFTLVATNDRGVTARSSVTVRPVALPTINSFSLQPPSINAPGDSVTANWSATNTRRMQLRVQNGPTVAINETAPNTGTVTFRAGGAQVYVLEAYNEAGDHAEATATLNMVNAPVVGISPTPTLAGNNATLSWSLGALGVTEVVGLPTPRPPKIATSPNFVDISLLPGATEFIFANRTDGAAELTLPGGFHFMLLGVERQKMWVSVNGFISLTAPAALSVNTDLTVASDVGPSLIAPYWDDLTMAPTSKVLAGFAPTLPTGERRFVVQWHKMISAGVEVSFQVQFTESGTVTFVYGAMNGQTGLSATIGVKLVDALIVQQHAFNTNASVTDADELGFFTAAPANGTFNFLATGSTLVTFAGRTPTGLMPFVVPLVALNERDLRITEAMPSPAMPVFFTGQWIEIQNTTDVPINLNGLTLRSTTSTPDGGHVFGNTVIPPRGHLVVGQSTDAVENGGANVTVVATDVPLLASDDEVTLSLDGVAIDSLSWSTATQGRSIQLVGGQGLLIGGTGGSTQLCTTGTQTFGADNAIGTPGATNEHCLPYRMERITGGFIPLGASMSDVQLLANASTSTGYGNVQLPAPFTYYGQPYNQISVSMAGFLTIGSPLTSAYSTTNDVLPNTTAPNGVVAPFWDQLVRNNSTGLWLRRAGNRTIVSWQDYRISGITNTQLNFQVHLFDTGVIEFHYGTFTPTTAASELRLRGSSATAWLETPSGGSAVAVGVNTDGTIVPNSGIRFTP